MIEEEDRLRRLGSVVVSIGRSFPLSPSTGTEISTGLIPSPSGRGSGLISGDFLIVGVNSASAAVPRPGLIGVAAKVIDLLCELLISLAPRASRSK